MAYVNAWFNGWHFSSIFYLFVIKRKLKGGNSKLTDCEKEEPFCIVYRIQSKSNCY